MYLEVWILCVPVIITILISGSKVGMDVVTDTEASKLVRNRNQSWNTHFLNDNISENKHKNFKCVIACWLANCSCNFRNELSLVKYWISSGKWTQRFVFAVQYCYSLEIVKFSFSLVAKIPTNITIRIKKSISPVLEMHPISLYILFISLFVLLRGV